MGTFSTVFSDPMVIALTAVIQFLLVVVGVFIIRVLHKISNKVGIDLDDKTEKSIESIVSNVVNMANQTMVSTLKKQSPTLSLTDEEAQAVYNRVYAIIKDILSSEQILFLENKYSSVNTGLEILIESAVATAKNEAPITLTPLVHSEVLDTNDVNIDVPIMETTSNKSNQKSSSSKKRKPSKPKSQNEKKDNEQKGNVVQTEESPFNDEKA